MVQARPTWCRRVGCVRLVATSGLARSFRTDVLRLPVRRLCCSGSVVMCTSAARGLCPCFGQEYVRFSLKEL